jgi:hypothetical protein
MPDKKLRVFSICAGLCGCLWLGFSPLARGQVLYEATLGTLPENQGWTYGALGTVTKSLVDNSALLDTSGALSTQAGWSRISVTNLNRTNGFSLLFTALLNAETHASTNRAGFSVIVLGADRRGIELGFWTNRVFAQADSPLFTHAEETDFSAMGGFVDYTLTILATNYVLQANGAAILSGPVRDYTSFAGFPNPYQTSNFIFFGDDTTSASASVNLRRVTLMLPPTLTTLAPGIVSWTGVSNQRYSVQVSTNLESWSLAGTATSPNNSFSFTNTPLQPRQFFRVVFP